MGFVIRKTKRESKCINCRETIEKGEPKLVFRYYGPGSPVGGVYKTCHLKCLSTEDGGISEDYVLKVFSEHLSPIV